MPLLCLHNIFNLSTAYWGRLPGGCRPGQWQRRLSWNSVSWVHKIFPKLPSRWRWFPLLSSGVIRPDWLLLFLLRYVVYHALICVEGGVGRDTLLIQRVSYLSISRSILILILFFCYWYDILGLDEADNWGDQRARRASSRWFCTEKSGSSSFHG